MLTSKTSKHPPLSATMSKQTSQKGAVLNDSATCIPDNAAFALASFVLDWHPRVQYFGLAALFPGGGWVGIGGWWILAFVFNLWVKIALPLSYSK
jgi:hypothetical protein